MMRGYLVVVALLLALVPSASAADMPLIYSVTDPKGDATVAIAGPAQFCYSVQDAGGNRGCDLLGLDVYSDGETLEVVFSVATTTWICPECQTEYRLYFQKPDGTPTGIRRTVESDGGHFDANYNTDRRTVVAAQWSVDTSANTVTARVDLADLGAQPGDSLIVDDIYTLTGYQTASGLHWTAKQDRIPDAPPIIIPLQEAEAEVSLHHGDAADKLLLSFSNATTGVYQYNLTATAELAASTVAWNVTAGTAHLVLTNASGTELVNRTLEGDGLIELDGDDTGPWRLLVSLEEFTGDVAWEAVVASESGLVGGSQEGGPSSNSTAPAPGDEETQEDGAANDAGDGPIQESPALGLLGSLAFLAIAARRR